MYRDADDLLDTQTFWRNLLSYSLLNTLFRNTVTSLTNYTASQHFTVTTLNTSLSLSSSCFKGLVTVPCAEKLDSKPTKKSSVNKKGNLL